MILKTILKLGIIFCVCVEQAMAQTPISSYQFAFSEKIRGQKIEVIIVQRNFNPQKHKIELVHQKDYSKEPWEVKQPTISDIGIDPFPKVDGRYPYGVFSREELLKSREITHFEVRWNGKPIAISPDLYADCYNLNLSQGYANSTDGGTWVTPSRDGKKILIQSHYPSDGESYTVWWVISSDGNHYRFVDFSTP